MDLTRVCAEQHRTPDQSPLEVVINQWVFGYGSLIFRPGFDYLKREIVDLDGYERRFWQGSHDHRGTPAAPGRVVTLIQRPKAKCTGIAYLIDAATVTKTFETLDHREKNGYERLSVSLRTAKGSILDGVVYMATPGNFAYLGDASFDTIAQQIADSKGPSGLNCDYLFDLAVALRDIGADDPHVFALEKAVRQRLLRPCNEQQRR